MTMTLEERQHYQKVKSIVDAIERYEGWLYVVDGFEYEWNVAKKGAMPKTITVDDYFLKCKINDSVKEYCEQKLKELRQEFNDTMITIG